MTTNILHITQQLSSGGAGRAILYLAKYSTQLDSYSHSILSLLPIDSATRALAEQHGVAVHIGQNKIHELIEVADIVQVSWWNNTEIYEMLRSSLPDSRIIGWFHCGGQSEPHIITNKLAKFFDCAAACSPYTIKCSALKLLAQEEPQKVTMILGATDFERLSYTEKRPHTTGFNVGYVGTVDFIKMHPDYVAMSAAAQIPSARFIVCGSGAALPDLAEQVNSCGKPGIFELKGQVDNVGEQLASFDVYGYPLCPDTYAASELNLQEAMYMGIAPVVFPYGGIQDLVIHNETGLVVNSASEYTKALETLYNDPQLLKRLSENARKYAIENFGAKNAAISANTLYGSLMKQPKRSHFWSPDLDLDFYLTLSLDQKKMLTQDVGAYNFLDSLGERAEPFIRSILELDILQALKADIKIAAAQVNLRQGGIDYYRTMYPQSKYLNYWAGLAALNSNLFSNATILLVNAVNLGFDNWRAILALTYASAASENQELKQQVHGVLHNQILPQLPSELAFAIKESETWDVLRRRM